jgi:hypothetical protein
MKCLGVAAVLNSRHVPRRHDLCTDNRPGREDPMSRSATSARPRLPHRCPLLHRRRARSALFTDACTSSSGHRGEADLPCPSVEARPSSRGQERSHQVAAFHLFLKLVFAPCSFPCRFGPDNVAVTKLQAPNHGQEHAYHLLDKMPVSNALPSRNLVSLP